MVYGPLPKPCSRVNRRNKKNINYLYKTLKSYFLNNNSDKNVINFNSKNDVEISKNREIKAEKEEILKKYDSFELNNLDYEEAINYDKRNFFQIYLCLLTREHKIIFNECILFY